MGKGVLQSNGKVNATKIYLLSTSEIKECTWLMGLISNKLNGCPTVNKELFHKHQECVTKYFIILLFIYLFVYLLSCCSFLTRIHARVTTIFQKFWLCPTVILITKCIVFRNRTKTEFMFKAVHSKAWHYTSPFKEHHVLSSMFLERKSLIFCK